MYSYKYYLNGRFTLKKTLFVIATYSRSISYAFLLMCLFVTQSSNAKENSDDFPGRKLYPNIDYIKISTFHKRLNNDEIIAIDVRSLFEFETLHINKAINIPVSSPLFVAKVQELRDSDTRAIVTYCNGKTCMKSYKAAKKLIENHLDNVLVFDIGIMDFAKAYPKEVLLLGSPLNNASRLISQSKFSKHLVNPEGFGKQIANSNAILLDIRDRVQREDGISLFAGREHRVTLDNSRRLDRYIEQAKKDNLGLLIYDAAGKQVRWLQYRLEKSGIKNYLFMAGGANAYYQYLEKL